MEEDNKVLDFVAYKEKVEMEKFLAQFATEENYKLLTETYRSEASAKAKFQQKLSKTEKQLKKDNKSGAGFAIASAVTASVALGGFYSAVQSFKAGQYLFGAASAIGAVVCTGISAFCGFCSNKLFKKAKQDKVDIKLLTEEIENLSLDMQCVHQDIERVGFYIGKTDDEFCF